MTEQTKAAQDVLAERRRQIDAEGWAPERDDGYTKGELGSAAAAYALCASCQAQEWDDGDLTPPRWWPWAPAWFKPSDQRRNLVKAGALILAEIERLDRAAMKGKP